MMAPSCKGDGWWGRRVRGATAKIKVMEREGGGSWVHGRGNGSDGFGQHMTKKWKRKNGETRRLVLGRKV